MTEIKPVVLEKLEINFRDGVLLVEVFLEVLDSHDSVELSTSRTYLSIGPLQKHGFRLKEWWRI